MAKRIIFSKKAELDLERIIEFNDYRNKSNSYSKKFFINLTKRLRLLLKQPSSGMITDSDDVFC
jgi:plasmid stabilization system protein ParE